VLTQKKLVMIGSWIFEKKAREKDVSAPFYPA